MELRKLVDQWREVWRVRGLTGRQAPIPDDTCCATFSRGQEDTSAMCRIFHNELSSAAAAKDFGTDIGR
jgi:hypothetical protein